MDFFLDEWIEILNNFLHRCEVFEEDATEEEIEEMAEEYAGKTGWKPVYIECEPYFAACNNHPTMLVWTDNSGWTLEKYNG